MRLLELNARTTMTHYALEAKRRVPRATRFKVVRLAELQARPGLLPLTDPESATAFCAVLDFGLEEPRS